MLTPDKTLDIPVKLSGLASPFLGKVEGVKKDDQGSVVNSKELWGVGRGCGSYSELLWLSCRLATVAPIRPLAWQLPYAAGAALKRQNKTKQNKN